MWENPSAGWWEGDLHVLPSRAYRALEVCPVHVTPQGQAGSSVLPKILQNRRVELWGGKRALWWPHVLGMSSLPVLGLEQESCLCSHQGKLSWIYLDC